MTDIKNKDLDRKARVNPLTLVLRINLIALLLLELFAGCEKRVSQTNSQAMPEAAARALRESPKLTLFSLDPDSEQKGEPGPRLHGFRILGETPLSPIDRERVTRAFWDDISHWDTKMGVCFLPRHALRAVDNGITYDFVICYECSNLEVFDPSDRFVVIGITGSGDVLNEVLRVANIPISEPPAGH